MPKLSITSCDTCSVDESRFWFTVTRQGPNWGNTVAIPSVKFADFPALYFCSIECLQKHPLLSRELVREE